MEQTQFNYQLFTETAAAWDAMYEALDSAHHSIYWEIYIFIDDEAGHRFVELLAQKARSGVEVKLIVDAFGSSKLSDKTETYLKASGVKFLRFNRFNFQLNFWNWYFRLTHRNHRKVLIVDKEIVFLGGVNIKIEYKDWNDVYLKLSGKIAEPLMRGFAKSYVSSGGNREDVKEMLRHKLILTIPELAEKLRFIVHSSSRAKLPKTKLYYLKALTIAKERVNILTPYYIPDRSFLGAVKIAKSKGVKVNIFIPTRIDLQVMELLSKSYFELTVKSGAEIYLLPKMNHGKALSVDDKLGIVGSINLMPRSFSHQEESAVSFTDQKMVTDLNAMFEELKFGAERLNIDVWRNRPWPQRFREWLAKKIEYFIK